MSTFSAAGRDLSGWAPVLELARSLFDEHADPGLRAGILYQRQMPETSPLDGASIDIRGGTSVSWNRPDDDMDHVWQARRIERLAPAWRGLLPSAIDFRGWSDAECSIEITHGFVTGYASREDGEETDSCITVIHRLVDGEWVPSVEISWTCDDPDSDVLAMDDDEVVALAERNGWRLHGVNPIGYNLADGNFVVHVPVPALADIDREEARCAA